MKFLFLVSLFYVSFFSCRIYTGKCAEIYFYLAVVLPLRPNVWLCHIKQPPQLKGNIRKILLIPHAHLCPLSCPLWIIQKLALPSSNKILHLADHETQILRNGKCESLNRNSSFPVAGCVVILTEAYFDILSLFSQMWKDVIVLIFLSFESTLNK